MVGALGLLSGLVASRVLHAETARANTSDLVQMGNPANQPSNPGDMTGLITSAGQPLAPRLLQVDNNPTSLTALPTGYRVFLTPQGDYYGLVVANKTTQSFACRLVAKRKDIPVVRLAPIAVPPPALPGIAIIPASSSRPSA